MSAHAKTAAPIQGTAASTLARDWIDAVWMTSLTSGTVAEHRSS